MKTSAFRLKLKHRRPNRPSYANSKQIPDKPVNSKYNEDLAHKRQHYDAMYVSMKAATEIRSRTRRSFVLAGSTTHLAP